ncbi:MAG: hypothetical protein ACR2GR_01700 [Rhodothermales bacterium]
MAKSKSIRTLIKDLEPDELREVIIELCKLSNKNKQFLALYLQSSEVASPEPVVEEAKQKIKVCFYGRGQFPKLDLRGARSVVSEYGKVLKDYPHEVTELKLYYVEVGTAITNEYGDLYENFYDSLASMFTSFCKDIKAHPSWYGDFEGRIAELESATYDIGWGYGDDITANVAALQEAIEDESDSARRQNA